jgi:hypothetical protein
VKFDILSQEEEEQMMDDIDENIFKVDLDGSNRIAQSHQSSASKPKGYSKKHFTAFSPPSI